MQAISSGAALLLLAGGAVAARISYESRLAAGALARHNHADRWCLSSSADPSCEDGMVMDIRSAFTAAAWPHCGAPPARDELSCDPNVTDAVIGLCQGERECQILPEMELSCTEVRQYSIRIAWKCVPGTPPAKDKFTEVDPSPAKPTFVRIEDTPNKHTDPRLDPTIPTLDRIDEGEDGLPTTTKEPPAARTAENLLPAVGGRGVQDRAGRWCLTATADPSCDEGTVVEVRSAFTSSAWTRCGAPPARDEARCSPNVTDAVADICRGEQTCRVPPEATLSCAGMKQHSVRITWACVPGAPKTATFTKLDVSGDMAEGVAKEMVVGDEVRAKETAKATQARAVVPGCPGSYEPGVIANGGRAPVTVCKDKATGELAKKVCCEETLPAWEKAVDACQMVPRWDCKPDSGVFRRKRSQYPEVPPGFVCMRQYACTLRDKRQVVGYLERVKDCGDMRGVARRTCIPEWEG